VIGEASISAVQILREATHEAHERLHGVPIFAALANGTLARDGYIALLRRLLGFHAPMEAAIAGALGSQSFGIDVTSWQRAALIQADLAALGADDRAAPGPALRPRENLTRAEAMGCLYVVEGSTLGGRQLARRLDTLLDGRGATGRQFLMAGAHPGHVRWATVCAALNACGRDATSRAGMIDGAAWTFAAFENWFSNPVSPG
jgi:heme oxygenase